MSWKAVIFDCDGTLVDSERVANEVLVDYLQEFGVALSMEESASHFNGVEMKDSIAQLERILGRPVPVDFEHALRTRLDRALAQRLLPVDGVRHLVSSLDAPYCVASNAPLAKIRLSLSVTGLMPLFEGLIHSAYQIGAWKPDPALFLHAARALGVAPSNCVVIEDSVPGVKAGIAAGMTVLAYQPHTIDTRLPKGIRIFTHFQELQQTFERAGLIRAAENPLTER